jgi:hypothetical protein
MPSLSTVEPVLGVDAARQSQVDTVQLHVYLIACVRELRVIVHLQLWGQCAATRVKHPAPAPAADAVCWPCAGTTNPGGCSLP